MFPSLPATRRKGGGWSIAGRRNGRRRSAPVRAPCRSGRYHRGVPGARARARKRRRGGAPSQAPVGECATMTELLFTEAELLAEHTYARPQIEAGYRLHGGFDADGTYVSPRTL